MDVTNVTFPPESNKTVHSDNPPPFYILDGWNLYISRVFVWLFPCLTITGGLMNAACFFVTATNRKVFPRNSRIYTLLISGTDAAVLLVKAPMYYMEVIATLVRDPWPGYRPVRALSAPVMYIYYVLTYTAMFGAPFYQLGLTVDRVVAVCFPMKAKLLMNRRNSAILLAAVLLLVFTFPITAAYSLRYNTETMEIYLVMDESYKRFHAQYELYVGRIFLAVFLLLGTALICLMLVRSSRAFANTSDAVGGGQRSDKVVRLSLVLIILNVNFLLFNLPWSILNTMYENGLTTSLPSYVVDALFECFNMLLYVSSSISWFAYFIGQGFRDKFVKTFRLNCLLRESNVKGGRSNGVSVRKTMVSSM